MNQKAIQRMKTLRNIGPVCATQMVKASIDTPEKLKKYGTKEAFLRLWESSPQVHCLNACYLYAIEGAIRDCDWREIPTSKKEEFKRFTKALRDSLGK